MPKIPVNLTAERLRELARTGADVTLKRLRAEIIAIERAFPSSDCRQADVRSENHSNRPRLVHARWSAAARKAVSARMKRYWAERRKAKVK